MPQLAPMILKDHQLPPQDHNFTPRGITGNVAELVETSGVPIGENRITISKRKTPSGRFKTVAKVQLPVVQVVTVNGVDRPTIVRYQYVDISFDAANTSTTQERDDAIGLTKSLLTNPLFLSVVRDLESIY